MIAQRLRLAEVFRDETLQEKKRPARHFVPSTHEESFHQLVAPPEGEPLMADVIRPMLGFAQEPLRLACRTFEELGQRLCGQTIKFLHGCDERAEPGEQILAFSHSCHLITSH